MSQPNKRNKIGATPGKLALVGLLSLVLVMVIVKQLPKSTPAIGEALQATQQTTQQQPKTEKSISKVTTTQVAREPSKLPPWPEIDFTETLASNPFALPRWEIQKKPTVVAPKQQSGELAELREQGASIVVIGKKEKTATIGDQKYHVGDILEGYQVTDITTRGIFLNKLDPH